MRIGNQQVQLVSLVVAGMGCLNVLSGLLPALHSRLALVAPYLPGVARHGAHLAAILAGFGLLLLSGSLRRRKRIAWYLVEALLILSAGSHLVRGLNWEEALGAAGLALWLWTLRWEFQAQSDPPSVRQGLRVLGAALLFTLCYGTAGFFLLDYHFSVNFSFGAAVRQTIVMFTQFYDPGLQPVTGWGRYFAASIYGVGAATLGYALLMLLRPVLVRQPATAAERARARRIVESFGNTCLAPFTLLPDKVYWFSPGGSMVAFVVKGRAAVVLGDPIGPPDDRVNAITGFQAYCSQRDWLPAFYQVLPEYLDAYHDAGFQTLQIGDEAVVDLKSFTVAGGENRTLRGALNHLSRAGYRTEYHPAPLPADLIRELRGVSDDWLSLMHGREKRYSLGWFTDDYLRESAVLLVRTPDGAVSAFANLVPEYKKDQITIDLMRHRRDVERGTMDLLFVRLFEWAREAGYASFSLGLSIFSGVGLEADDPAAERALHFVYEHLNQFYHFQGLHAFKDKFHPRWEPRYLVFPAVSALPAVSLALIRADSGDEFVRDYLQDLLRNPHTAPTS